MTESRFEPCGGDVFCARGFYDDKDIELITMNLPELYEYAEDNPYYGPEDKPKACVIEHPPAVDLLFEGTQTLLDDLRRFYSLSIVGGSAFRYGEYPAGRGYKRHIDRSNLKPHLRNRTISVVIGLNSDYEGGDLYFPRQEVRVKIGKGDVVMFPSTYTHPHEVEKVTKGVRKNIVTWLD